MSARLVWRVAAVAGLAAVWAVAAYFLWDSVIPSSLSLPDLDPHRYFSAHTLSRTADFERFLELTWVAEQVLLVAVFVAYARWGVGFMKESAAGPIGTGIFLAMMGFALTWFVRLPFEILNTWWERRYHVLNVSYLAVVCGG